MGFSASLAGTMNQYNKTVSVTEVLDEAVNIEELKVSQTSFIKDSNGQIISEIYEADNRIILPYEEIPEHVIHAFIATEDQHFYSHQGFDLFGITRALLVNARQHTIEQGGSTITQQLIRTVYLGTEKSYNRKLSELLYAYQLEKEQSKEKIIEMYVNTIYFQNHAYGIEAAAQFYFSKHTNELSLGEIAFLCAIPNNPNFYNPLLHYDNTKQRQKWMLSKMLETDYITQSEYEQALSEDITLTIKERTDLHPNFVTFIHEELKQLISQKEGFKQQLLAAATNEEIERISEQLTNRINEVIKSGIVIETSLNPKLQHRAEAVLEQKLRNTDIEGAVVVIDHSSHGVVAIVGGKTYKKHDFHRAFQAYRQPGSAIKPLLVYGPYLAEFGYSTSSSISAGPFCKNGYCPENYGNSQYGAVSLETALKYSYNTAAVRILDIVGIDKAFDYLEAFEFNKIVKEDRRLPAAIGGFTNGITPLELTNAYTTFANKGTFLQARGIRKVTDLQGNTLYTWHEEPALVWDEKTNDKMRDLLHKVMTEGTGKKGYYSSEYIGGKTGTTNDFKDLWIIGLNENYTTGVWIGKDNPASIEKVNNSSPHLAIWREIMLATKD